MIRLPIAAAAAVLFVVPLLAAAIPPVVVTGLIAVLLATLGIATLWRWPMTAAACVFLTDYATALWVAGAPVSVVGAVGFGLVLLLLLQSAELARCTRHAVVDAGVVRSQVIGWMAFAAATLGAAALVMGLADAAATAVPFTAAPVLAAAGALGVVLSLVLALTRSFSPAPRPSAASAGPRRSRSSSR
jgi:hypothetical protein